MVESSVYYATYNGHAPEHLRAVHDELRRGGRSAIFLAGDSSLDNKFWFGDTAVACNGYERVLCPAVQKQDVCYWLNHEATTRGRSDLFCINTAVEATSLNHRAFGALLAQDRFIREHITPQDVLIVSVGGNDLALEPLVGTILNIVPLLCFTPKVCIQRGQACPPNTHVDCGCFGCGAPGCAVCCFGCPPGLAYFVDLFKNRVENYVRRLVGRQRPRKVVVCMIYYLDVHGRGSWADCFLKCMCYDCAPSRLQAAIRRVFELATSRISIEGTEVVAFPLFEVLDGSDPADYVQRVEPSPRGGAKMARALMDAVIGLGDGEASPASPSEGAVLCGPSSCTVTRDYDQSEGVPHF